MFFLILLVGCLYLIICAIKLEDLFYFIINNLQKEKVPSKAIEEIKEEMQEILAENKNTTKQ